MKREDPNAREDTECLDIIMRHQPNTEYLGLLPSDYISSGIVADTYEIYYLLFLFYYVDMSSKSDALTSSWTMVIVSFFVFLSHYHCAC